MSELRLERQLGTHCGPLRVGGMRGSVSHTQEGSGEPGEPECWEWGGGWEREGGGLLQLRLPSWGPSQGHRGLSRTHVEHRPGTGTALHWTELGLVALPGTGRLCAQW